MRTSPAAAARSILPALALVGVLAGCTAAPGAAGPGATSSTSVGAAPRTSSAAATPSTVPAGEGPVGPEEEAVAFTLATYQRNVAAGDVVLACSQMTVESATALVTTVQGTGPAVPTCPDALAAVIAQPGAQEAAIEAANSIVVDDVVVEGLSATVTWTSTRQDVARTDTVRMQNIDGQWRLAGPA